MSTRRIVQGLLLSALALQLPTSGFARSLDVHDGVNQAAASNEDSEMAAASDLTVVYFADGRSRATAGSIRNLRAVQRMLAAHPELRTLRIEGHADDTGDAAFNLAVSKRRVRSVAHWLVENGVAAQRLQLLACGNRYAEGSTSPTAQAANRRVELTVSDPAQGGAERDRCDPIEPN